MIVFSTNSTLQDAVSAMVKSITLLPQHDTLQLSLMVLESITDSDSSSLCDNSAVSSLFDLLLLAASCDSIISKTINKLLTEWLLSKIQIFDACQVSIGVSFLYE